MRIIIWGIGRQLMNNIHLLDKNDIICFVDSDLEKHENNFLEKSVILPQQIKDFNYDYIVISSDKFFHEIKCDLETKLEACNEKIINLDYYLFLTGRIELHRIVDRIATKIKEIGLEYNCQRILDYGCWFERNNCLVEDTRRIAIDGFDDVGSYNDNLVVYNKVYCKNNMPNSHYNIILSLSDSIMRNNILLDGFMEISDFIWVLIEKYDSDIVSNENIEVINIYGFLFYSVSKAQKDSVKIYEVSHKNFESVCNPIYYPLYVKNIDDLNEKALYAHTGNNIASLNPKINEYTGIYYIWKNDRAEYVGINHYRRFFASNMFGGCIQKIEVLLLLKKYDVLVADKVTFRDETVLSKLKTEINEDAFNVSIEAVRNLFLNKDFKEYNAYKYVFEGNAIFPCNMFVMSWDLFEQYCTWIFPIINKLVASIEIKEEWDDYSKRVIGFIAERLLTVWLVEKKYSLKELEILYTG